MRACACIDAHAYAPAPALGIIITCKCAARDSDDEHCALFLQVIAERRPACMAGRAVGGVEKGRGQANAHTQARERECAEMNLHRRKYIRVQARALFLPTRLPASRGTLVLLLCARGMHLHQVGVEKSPTMVPLASTNPISLELRPRSSRKKSAMKRPAHAIAAKARK